MTLKYPILIINLKTYFGDADDAIKMANIARKVAEDFATDIVLCPSHLSLREISKIVPTFAQHIDQIEPGAHTGYILASEVKKAGALGTLINHSEKRIDIDDIKKCIDICKKINLISCVCAKSDEEAEAIAKLEPDTILAEPPELVGGDVSVSTARPEIIRDSVKKVKKISPATFVLCGAGIKNRDDVKKAIALGADGVGVSSGIVKARDVEKAMRDIVGGLVK